MPQATTASSSPQVITLSRPEGKDGGTPAFRTAQILPRHGMMVLRIGAWLPGRGDVDVLVAPPTTQALKLLAAGGEFPGNAAFSMGGAILIPFANRIRGTLSSDGTGIATTVFGKQVELPANWGGKAPGAERYAMHGLALAASVNNLTRSSDDASDRVRAVFDAGNFGGHWLSSTRVEYLYALSSGAFSLAVTARNVGTERLPIGIGWHPYFAIPSGNRSQARLRIPAAMRVAVNDYDEVLPTGELLPVSDTSYDFRVTDGRALGDRYLDDCFVGLERDANTGDLSCEIVDPAAQYGLRVTATSPQVRAVQVYAPPGEQFVALEPQFNLADPFGAEWGRGVNTGMVSLEPGESVTYSVRLELFTPEL